MSLLPLRIAYVYPLAFFSFSIQVDGLEVAKKAPEINQAILDFYETEGITE